MKVQLGDVTKLVVGKKQVIRALSKGEAEEVFLARDADTFIGREIREAVARHGAVLTEVDSMSVLGKACGIEIGAAVAARLRKIV